MLICKKCGEVFDLDDLKKIASFTVDGWTRYEWDDRCPDCGSDDYTDAELCLSCGKWFPADELLDGDVCWDCAKDAMTTEALMAYAEDDMDAWGRFVAQLIRERRAYDRR